MTMCWRVYLQILSRWKQLSLILKGSIPEQVSEENWDDRRHIVPFSSVFT